MRAIHAEVRSLRRRQRNIEDDLRILSAYEEVINVLVPALETEETLEHYEYLGVVFERKSQRARDLLEKEVHARCSGACVFYQASISKGRVAALIGFAPEHDNTVRELIGQTGISEVRGPRYLRGKSFRDIMTVLPQDLQRLRGQVQVLDERKQAFFTEKGALLLALHGVCHDRHSRLTTLSKFAQSHFTFIMEGWVPAESLNTLETTLKEKCGPDITLRKIRPHGAAGSPPVFLKNSLAIKPFQSLLNLLPLPKYGSIDPTSYVAIFFPPMFGLMLGDIGYGLILGLLTLWMWRFRKRKPAARPFVLITGSLAFFTIAFGFVFGEFFGDFGHQLGLHPLWRERLVVGSPQMGSTLLIYLLFSIALGTGIAQSRIGAAGAGTIAEKPEATGTIIPLVAIPETMVILGFVIAVILLFTL